MPPLLVRRLFCRFKLWIVVVVGTVCFFDFVPSLIFIRVRSFSLISFHIFRIAPSPETQPLAFRNLPSAASTPRASVSRAPPRPGARAESPSTDRCKAPHRSLRRHRDRQSAGTPGNVRQRLFSICTCLIFERKLICECVLHVQKKLHAGPASDPTKHQETYGRWCHFVPGLGWTASKH